MAIKRFGDYENTRGYSDFQQLPKGGYVVRIMGAKVLENSNGQYVEVSCDIAEGEFKDFYANDYRNQSGEDKKWHCKYLLNVPSDDGSESDGWTKRRFKTFTEALEDSNPGYHFDWDESKFKGKIIGGLFNSREYTANDGSIRTATSLAAVTAADKVRSGNYRLPKDRLVERKAFTPSPADAFMSVNDDPDGLPFD